jgi:hypothetical protein
MKFLATNSTRFASVLDEHWDRLSKFKWFDNGRVIFRSITSSTKRNQYGVKANEYITLSNEVMMTRKVKYDHKNRDYLHNLPENLRVCNSSQNAMNRVKRTRTSSKYLGVSWKRLNKKWQAQIVKDRKKIYIGLFESEIDAAKAFDKKAFELYGEFAVLNFPEGHQIATNKEPLMTQ